MTMNVHPLTWIMANITWSQVPGYVGAAFVVLSFVMKTMIPLRVMTILSNVCFIAYSYMEGQYPTLFLHMILLPLNAVRIYQMLLLTRRVRAASQGEQTLGSLRPFMRRSHCKKGRVLFRKGDPADALYYLVSGEFLVTEIGVVLRGGSYVGELGLLAPSGRRTQTLECIAEGELLSISYEHVRELYLPKSGFRLSFPAPDRGTAVRKHQFPAAAGRDAASGTGGGAPGTHGVRLFSRRDTGAARRGRGW